MTKTGRIEYSRDRQAQYDPIAKEVIADIGPHILPGFSLAHELTEEFYEAGDVFFADPDGQEIVGFEGECRPVNHFDPLWEKKYSGIGIPIGKINDRNEWEFYVIANEYNREVAIVIHRETIVDSPVVGRFFFNNENKQQEWGEFYDVDYSKAIYCLKKNGSWIERPVA